MTNKNTQLKTNAYTNVSTTDRLAQSRAQHFQQRENRPKSVSDDEVGAISDWSESDRECCPLSDLESIPDTDIHHTKEYVRFKLSDEDIYKNKPSEDISYSNNTNNSTSPRNPVNANEIPHSIIDDSATSTRISFSSEIDKPKNESNTKTSANPVKSRRHMQPPLLPARHIQPKQVSPRRPSTRSTMNSQLSYTCSNLKKISASPARIYFRRETACTTTSLTTQLTKDSAVSSTYSFQSHDDNHNQRQTISPSLSQASVPRAYQIKKMFVDDYDYGRLTDISSTPPTRSRSRQKWGTIVHPPFPLGYQHIAPDRISQAVERLANPPRCRERHTRTETPSKRYLSIEETNSLVNNS